MGFIFKKVGLHFLSPTYLFLNLKTPSLWFADFPIIFLLIYMSLSFSHAHNRTAAGSALHSGTKYYKLENEFEMYLLTVLQYSYNYIFSNSFRYFICYDFT